MSLAGSEWKSGWACHIIVFRVVSVWWRVICKLFPKVFFNVSLWCSYFSAGGRRIFELFALGVCSWAWSKLIWSTRLWVSLSDRLPLRARNIFRLVRARAGNIFCSIYERSLWNTKAVRWRFLQHFILDAAIVGIWCWNFLGAQSCHTRALIHREPGRSGRINWIRIGFIWPRSWCLKTSTFLHFFMGSVLIDR